MRRDHRCPFEARRMMELFLEPAREIEIRWIRKRRRPERELARVEARWKVRGL